MRETYSWECQVFFWAVKEKENVCWELNVFIGFNNVERNPLWFEEGGFDFRYFWFWSVVVVVGLAWKIVIPTKVLKNISNRNFNHNIKLCGRLHLVVTSSVIFFHNVRNHNHTLKPLYNFPKHDSVFVVGFFVCCLEWLSIMFGLCSGWLGFVASTYMMVKYLLLACFYLEWLSIMRSFCSWWLSLVCFYLLGG